ncbi:MAG: UbiA prenyltransferase family protein [Dysgonamonadaceae bacterium]|jgi:4-hydroxybenzoate polyprenyltransferase|nr:UbiA prenyltransferase family protein [Dysgonamonadaceae bacterium]
MFLKPIIQLLRLCQWTKNGFIFLPLFFSGQMLNIALLAQCFTTFVAFSLAAGAVYCLNDIYDVEADRRHPVKCKRPVAAGKITVKTAYFIMAVCFMFSMFVVFVFGNEVKFTVMALIAFYFVMNIAYCIKLKRYAIVDVMVISIGFVLRILVGGQATDIWLSEWIIILTFLLALFLAFAKRRDDVVLYQNTGVAPRRNTNCYSLDFMNQVMTFVAAITVIAYIMYTLSPDVTARFHSTHVYLTAFFVLTGIIRYLQVTIVYLQSGNPTKLLFCDRFIQVCIAGWTVSFLIIIYL